MPMFFKATNSYETDLFVQLNENALNDAFPNVNILLKIYLCMFATNCKGERSFSKLKLILNFLRNTMGQERLSSLALLAIEYDLLLRDRKREERIYNVRDVQNVTILLFVMLNCVYILSNG